MSSNTETRILEMQLDNKDFEAGVRQTIKSLEALEEKLDLKNAGNGFEKVSAAANSVQMGHLESGLDAVTSKFTLMGQIGLQVLERISSRVVNLGENILRSATIQPMIDGWGEFEMKTNSVQTILGGIRNQFNDQPTAINAISVALDELNEYADKTIYNFAQMTENVGKFTNQGLGLEESTNAIKGIANWAAAVGANPAQMSRAMYNISQSLGAGSMQLIDWRSIRFANMATPEVKKLFAEVAKVQGTLTEDGKIKIGKQTLDVLEDFESTLKGGWLTNEVMAEAFSIYANAFSETELIEKYGQELGHQFYEMGVYASEAATKVRTFTQLIDVLKEALGSGWANTFDILFGGFEQQTAFLTAIKDRLEEIVNFQTEDRNAWLKQFSEIGGVVSFQDTILRTIDILSDFYWIFNDVAARVLNPFGSGVFNMDDGIFGPIQEGYTDMQSTWEGVKAIFDDVNGALEKFREWMYAPDEETGRSPIHNLANALSGVAGAAGIAWQVISGFGKFVIRIFKRFEPVVSSVLDLLGQVGGAIYNVFFNLTGQKSVDKIFDKIEKAIGPVVDLVAGLASAVIDLIHSFLGIDSAADDWTVLGERMEAFWKIFSYNSDLSFADNLKNSLKQALISVFGSDTAASLIQAWDENVAPVLEQISGFFTEAFADLNHVLDGLRSASEADYSQSDGIKSGAKTFLEAFLAGYYGEDIDGAEETYQNILGIYQEIKAYYDQNVAPYVDSLNDIFTVRLPALNAKISDFLFGHEITGKRGNKWREGGLLETIQGYFQSEEVQSVLEAIGSVFDQIKAGIELRWNQFNEFLFGHEITGKQGNKWREGGLIARITDFFSTETWAEDWEQIKGAFTSISDWIQSTGNAAWDTIMDFLFGEETTVITGPGQAFSYRSGGAYDAAIAFLTPVWDWIQEKGSLLYDYITTHNFEEMWDGLNHLLFGYETSVITGPGQTFSYRSGGLLTPLMEILQPISDAFTRMKTWALEKVNGIDWGGVWESIGRFFGGYDELVVYDGGRSKEIVHHEGVFEKIASFFDRVITYFESPEFQEFLANVKSFYHTYIEPMFNWLGGLGGEIWTSVEGLFSGQGLGALDGLGDYLSSGFNKLIGKIFPEGFDLSSLLGGDGGILGMLIPGFSNGGEKLPEAPDGGQAKGSGGILGWLISSAEAAEAEEPNIVNAANTFSAVMDSAEGSIQGAADQGEKSSHSILDSVSKLLPYVGGAAAIGLVGKVSDLVTGVTGNRKPTILEQISGLLSSIGEPLKGLGIALAGASAAEFVSPGTIDKVFGHIGTILDKVFSWVEKLFIGGGIASIVGWGAGQLFGGDGISFDKITGTIASIGEGLSGIFEGIQTLYNLAWEVWLADEFFGFDEGSQQWNFDKKLDRVIGFVGKIMGAIIGSSWWLQFINIANTFVSALGNAKSIGKGKVSSETVGQMFTGIGVVVSAVCDGLAALMTASIVPSVLNVDIDKITGLITGALGAVNAIALGIEGATVLTKVLQGNWWEPLVTLAAGGAGLGAALLAIGGIAKVLVDWYLTSVEERLTTMAPAIYTFISNITGVVQMLASLGQTQLGDAETILSKDLPRLLGYISPEKLGYNKDNMNEAGTILRDFGNRVYNGINSLARAKDVFDKYHTGDNNFPLDFFTEMTEALGYLQGDGIKELYDSVFGQGGFFVGKKEEADIDGLNSFFTTLGGLGWTITKHQETGFTAKTTEEVVSTKEGLDAFQDAFSGIQNSFHLLFNDISDEKFDIKKVNDLGDFLKKIAEAGDTFSKSFYYESNVVKLYEQTSPITQFAGWLQTMGTGIRQLDDALKTNGKYDIDYTQLEAALGSLKPMADIEKTLYEYYSSERANAGWSPDVEWEPHIKLWLDALTPQMQSIGEGLHTMAGFIQPGDVEALTAASGTLSGLASFMTADLYTGLQTMTTEQIGGYATAFGGLKQSLLISEEEKNNSIASLLQGVFNATGGKPISLRITPIYDDSNLAGQLPKGMEMENTYSRMINMSMNMSDVQNVKVDAAQIDALTKANNETRDKIDALATSIGRIRLQFNIPPAAQFYGTRNRTVETYPLVANYQSPFDEDNP